MNSDANETETQTIEKPTELTAVTLADGTELVGMVTRVRSIWRGRGDDDEFPHRSIEFSPIRIGGDTIQIHVSGGGPNLAYGAFLDDEFVLTLVPRTQGA